MKTIPVSTVRFTFVILFSGCATTLAVFDHLWFAGFFGFLLVMVLWAWDEI